MRTLGRLMLNSLASVVVLLCVASGTAFAAGAVTPELQTKADRVRSQMAQEGTNSDRQAAADALKAMREQVYTYQLMKADPTQRVKGGDVTPQGVLGIDFDPIPVGPFDAAGSPSIPDYNTTANWAFTPPVAKFVDSLPPLCTSANGFADTNNLGQCLPIAVPDTVTYPGSDYYEISLREWKVPMHSDMLMNGGTPYRGYVQTNDGTDATAVASGCAAGATPSENTCNTIAPPPGQFLGPVIIAQRDRPVRLKFTNELPYDSDGLPGESASNPKLSFGQVIPAASGHRNGDLFIPVDESVMGAGPGPAWPLGASETRGTVNVCNNDDLENNNCEHFSQNRATVHLHGGLTPWISDGTPHQWTTPKDEKTPYPQGVSVAMVPDMPDPGDGSITFYYSNQQSARLMFYHDHAFGITRLNVLAGEAAGYLIQDEYEKDLMARQIIPGNEPGEMIPLVMQDRTFVDATPVPNPYNNNQLTPRIRVMDPLWNWGTGPFEADGKTRIPQTGDLWLPHVYMPAQDPFIPDLSGLNPFGRWMYGPWFYPPTTQINHGPVPNPYHDPDCYSNDTWVLTNCETPGQPPLIPGTPHPSMGMEAFFDSWVVNGTAFPTLTVEPKAYRFRILNAANDRALNLSIYKADGTPANMSPVAPGGRTPFSGALVSGNFDPKTEVKMAPAAATAGWPELWPIDGRAEGVPDPGDCSSGRCSNWGPSWIQIGTDAGFMPAPAVIDPQPVTYVTDPTLFWVGIVQDVALALMPAERADVIVDFSQYVDQTLIVYNDAPAAWPAGVFNYDYWTGAPDYRDSGGYGAGGTFNAVTGLYDGGHGPLPGFAPNTRTVMQIKVGSTVTAPSTSGFDLPTLENEFIKDTAPATTLNPSQESLFERAMAPVIVAQSGYDAAYGKTFPSIAPWGGYRYSIDDGHIFTFQTINDEQVSVLMKPKGIHDEMGAAFDPEYGRMSGNLAIEMQPPATNAANLNLYSFSDVPTEIIEDSGPEQVQVDVLGQLADGTQIWNISHNGVDTHPIHFHIFDVQVISRLGWDNAIMMPPANQLGWKDTVRISPLMDTVVAVRPRSPALPFGIPDSLRPLNPALRLGSEMGFSSVDPVTGQAYIDPSFWAPGNDPNWPGATGVHNVMYNFGWEYVWHCHILSHEEMDMMRPIILQVATLAMDNFSMDASGLPDSLSWTDPTPIDYTLYPDYLTGTLGDYGDHANEIGFNIWRSTGGTGPWTKIGSTLANHTTYDVTGHQIGDIYVIEAYNAGNATYSDALGTITLNVAPGTSFTSAPQDLTLSTSVGAPLSANSIDRVEYYDGTTLIGTVAGGDGAPYSLPYNGLQAGTYSLTALVVALAPDNSELYAVSDPTIVTIGGGFPVNAFTANGGATITPCDSITLTSGAILGGVSPWTYSWLVNGVTYTGNNAVVPALPAGVYPVVLTVTDSNSLVATVTQDITVVGTPPIANAGGPYSVDVGGIVTLAGSGTLGDACNGPLSIAWNMDSSLGSTTYEYSRNASFTYAQLASLLGVGTHPITFKVTDTAGLSSTAVGSLAIGAVPYSITTTALNPGIVDAVYGQQLTVTGAAPNSTWQVYGLPAGLTLDPATGIISGTPTSANIRAGSTTATFPISIINVDLANAGGPAYTTAVLFMTISL